MCICCLKCALLPSGVSASTMVLHSSGKTADSQPIATVDIGVAID